MTYTPNLRWIGPDDSERLEGFVVKIANQNPTTGWTVAQLQPGAAGPVHGSGMQTVKIVGVLPDLTAGNVLSADGRWRWHPRYGREFVVAEGEYDVRLPVVNADEQSGILLAYLGSRLIRGVGKRTAQRIVGTFGAEATAVITEQPERLATISGVTKANAEAIAKAWPSHADIRGMLAELHRRGQSLKLGIAIARRLGDDGVDRFFRDPAGVLAEIKVIEREHAERAIAYRVQRSDQSTSDGGEIVTWIAGTCRLPP